LILDQQDTSGSITDLSKALADNAGIYLPPNTSASELVKVLLIAVKQLSMSTAGEDDTHVVNTQSIFMSLPQGTIMPFTTEQAKELVNLGLLDPETKEALKLEDIKEHINDEPVVDPKAQADVELWMSTTKAIHSQFTNTLKDNLRKRVDVLVANNESLKKHADDKLYPGIDAINLSIDPKTSQIVSPAIEETISALESMNPVKQNAPAPKSPADWFSVPADATIHDGLPVNAEDQNPQRTPEEQEAAEKQFLSLLNV
jgi:hypothetical protein